MGGVVLEAEPFEWFRSNWEVLEIRASRETGWRYLSPSAIASLNGQYLGAHGSVANGLKGLIVQYLEDTGGPAVQVTDWRGNTAGCAYLPGNGLELREIHGTADDPGGPYYEATIRLARVA